MLPLLVFGVPSSRDQHKQGWLTFCVTGIFVVACYVKKKIELNRNRWVHLPVDISGQSRRCFLVRSTAQKRKHNNAQKFESYGWYKTTRCHSACLWPIYSPLTETKRSDSFLQPSPSPSPTLSTVCFSPPRPKEYTEGLHAYLATLSPAPLLLCRMESWRAAARLWRRATLLRASACTFKKPALVQ